MTPEIVIDVRRVSKSFPGVQAVADMDVRIHRGEYVALLGPNGAGKTTLVEMIEGLQHPDSGEIVLFGKTWHEAADELRHRLGISLQETRFIDKLTVAETFDLFASFCRERNGSWQEIMGWLGLDEKKDSYVVNLSGGTRQKLALGIALINRPDILILDEPTTGLDPHARREIWCFLEKLKSRGTTLILTTHYMEEAEYLCDRILIMDKGRMLDSGTLDELLTRHGRREIISFTLGEAGSEAPWREVAGFLDLEWEETGRRGCLKVRDIVAALPDFWCLIEREKHTLLQLECRKMNLDDLFIAMTGRRLDE